MWGLARKVKSHEHKDKQQPRVEPGQVTEMCVQKQTDGFEQWFKLGAPDFIRLLIRLLDPIDFHGLVLDERSRFVDKAVDGQRPVVARHGSFVKQQDHTEGGG